MDSTNESSEAVAQRRLLIVEDDQDTRELLSAFLAHPQVAISTAPNGPEGLERAWREKPHVILADYMMPEMDGFDLFVDLRRAAFAPRILLLSAHAPAELLRLAKELGAYACLRKPIDESLRATVLRALDLEEIGASRSAAR